MSLGAVLLLAACEHAQGGTCQSNRDCEDGLVCDLSLDEQRGVCRAPGDIDAGSDAGMQPDGSAPLPPDPTPDAATSDAGDSGSVTHEDGGGDGG